MKGAICNCSIQSLIFNVRFENILLLANISHQAQACLRLAQTPWPCNLFFFNDMMWLICRMSIHIAVYQLIIILPSLPTFHPRTSLPTSCQLSSLHTSRPLSSLPKARPLISIPSSWPLPSLLKSRDLPPLHTSGPLPSISTSWPIPVPHYILSSFLNPYILTSSHPFLHPLRAISSIHPVQVPYLHISRPLSSFPISRPFSSFPTSWPTPFPPYILLLLSFLFLSLFVAFREMFL